MAEHLATIRHTYRRATKDLDLAGASLEEGLEPGSAASRLELSGAMLRASDWSALQPDETEAARVAPQDGTRLFRGSAGRDHAGNRISVPVKSIIRRDLAWTVAIALVSSIGYVLTGDLYSGAWGTATDYLSAFVVGFAGKAVAELGRPAALPELSGRPFPAQLLRAHAAPSTVAPGGVAPASAVGPSAGATAPGVPAAASPPAAP